MRLVRAVQLVTLLLAVVVLAAGCDDDGGSEEPSGAGNGTPAAHEVSVAVAAEDNSFDPDEITVPPGTEEVRIMFTNVGDNPHTFTTDVIDSGRLLPGETKTLVFPPPEEDTEFFCKIHGDLGMVGELQLGV